MSSYSPGGVTRSLIWESLIPSAYRRSRVRRRGQPEEQRAEIDDQEQPASIKSFSPAKSREDNESFWNVLKQNRTQNYLYFILIRSIFLTLWCVSVCIPGRRPISQFSCFFEMLVHERSSVTGCLFMMPVRACGVTVRLMLRSIRAQSRLSKHLWASENTKINSLI